MKLKTLTLLTLAVSIPAVLFATVDIGGTPVGGAGNDITGAGQINASIVQAPTIGATTVSATTVWANTVNTADMEGLHLNVGSHSTNTLITNGDSSIGMSNFVSAGNSLAVGLGIKIVSRPNTLVVGEYNSEVGAGDIVFSVGNGTGPAAADRSNAFEVREDGKVIVSEPQGDIPMGSYTTQ